MCPLKRHSGLRLLTAKQQAFVREYAVDHNGTQAAIRAGASPASAKVTASRWLTNANVRAAIDSADVAVTKKLHRTAEDIAAFHWSVIDNPEYPIGERLKASNQEMRRFGEYSDKQEIDARVGVVLVRGTKRLA